MVIVRKCGKVYEYRIEIASIDRTRKWLTKSGFKTKQEALHEGALEEHLKTNKPVMFDKESVKVKKDRLDCMNKVIKDAKKIDEMKLKLDSTFKSMKNFSDNLSKTQKENQSLNRKLENQIAGLSDTIDYLQSIIKAIIEFVYYLFNLFRIPKDEELDFRYEFNEHIPQRLYKDKDDFEL